MCSSQRYERTTPNTKPQPQTKQLNKTSYINRRTIKEESGSVCSSITLILQYFHQGIEKKTRSFGIRGTGGPLVAVKSSVPRPHSSLAVPNLGQACLSSKHIVLDPRQPSGFSLQVRLALQPLQEQPCFVAPYPVHVRTTGPQRPTALWGPGWGALKPRKRSRWVSPLCRRESWGRASGCPGCWGDSRRGGR